MEKLTEQLDSIVEGKKNLKIKNQQSAVKDLAYHKAYLGRAIEALKNDDPGLAVYNVIEIAGSLLAAASAIMRVKDVQPELQKKALKVGDAANKLLDQIDFE